ncbi:Poly(A) polymerase pla1 [Symbiodinium microadriaticum]|uniref:polynucleotide adenylyltransferase n=1 Tax=Symbiodinium microadriaticum TaxID=2951 RepID=A0A1Q9EZ31_SYMMI|nr:Poly(A) polymerase pla1 [Symbiodinium microadriaticum]
MLVLLTEKIVLMILLVPALLTEKIVRMILAVLVPLGLVVAVAPLTLVIAAEAVTFEHLVVSPSMGSCILVVLLDYPTASSDGLLNGPGVKFKQRGTAVKLLFAASSHLTPAPVPVPTHAARWGESVSNRILEQVPDRARFCELLALVRYWAQQRGVFGSLFGFFSGTAWAICCGCICQMHPGATTAEPLSSFFQDLCCWDWSAPISMSTESLEPGKIQGRGDGQLVVKLPIGEGLSATPNMCEFALRAIQKELKRAVKLLGYRHYIQFDFLTKEEEIMDEWLSWGQSQIQELLQHCESMNDNKVTLRPWPCLVDFKDGDWPHARAIFIGIHRQRMEGEDAATKQVIDFREIMVKFLVKISAWPEAERYENQFWEKKA